MSHLFNFLQKNETTLVNQSNLSPQKYEKADFYQNKSYTPTKLVQSIFFKEMSALKKIEQGNSKIRQYQTEQILLNQKFTRVSQEKEGIQNFFNQQITMYKKMINQKQKKNQQRIKQIQKKFKDEIGLIIDQKQKDGKFYIQEKKLLQNRIQQLDGIVKELNIRLSKQGDAYNDLKNQIEKIQIKLKISQEYSQKLQKDKAVQIQKVQNRYKNLSQDYRQAQNSWKKQLQQIQNKKQQEKLILQASLRQRIKELQNMGTSESQGLNDQIRKLNQVLQTQQRNFQNSLKLKQQIIQKLNKEISQSRKVMLSLKQKYENQLNKVCLDNNNFQQIVAQLSVQNKHLVRQLKECEQLFSEQKLLMSQHIQKLKQELSFNQINYVREKDKNTFVSIDLQKQLRRLSVQNKHLIQGNSEKQLLVRQLSQLKQLLMESSRQIQACKQRFISFQFQNNQLRSQIQRFIYQNQNLQRIQKQLQQEVLKWRKNYLRLAQ